MNHSLNSLNGIILSYGLKLGWGGPIPGCIGGTGGELQGFKKYVITLVQGSWG